MTDISQLSPDDQLKGFSKRPLLPVLFLALVVHVVVIAGTSIGYVMELLNPPPAMEGQDAAVVENEDGDGQAADAGEDGDADAGAGAGADATSEGGEEGSAASTEGEGQAEITGSSEAEALKNDPKVKNKDYIEETFIETEDVPEDLGASEDLLDFGE